MENDQLTDKSKDNLGNMEKEKEDKENLPPTQQTKIVKVRTPLKFSGYEIQQLASKSPNQIHKEENYCIEVQNAKSASTLLQNIDVNFVKLSANSSTQSTLQSIDTTTSSDISLGQASNLVSTLAPRKESRSTTTNALDDDNKVSGKSIQSDDAIEILSCQSDSLVPMQESSSSHIFKISRLKKEKIETVSSIDSIESNSDLLDGVDQTKNEPSELKLYEGTSVDMEDFDLSDDRLQKKKARSRSQSSCSRIKLNSPPYSCSRIDSQSKYSSPPPRTSDESSDSDVNNKIIDDYIIVTSNLSQNGKLPDLIMGARGYGSTANQPSRSSSLDNLQQRSGRSANYAERKVVGKKDNVKSFADELLKDDHSIIHIKPVNPDLVAPPLGAIARNPLKEGVRIALPHRDQPKDKPYPSSRPHRSQVVRSPPQTSTEYHEQHFHDSFSHIDDAVSTNTACSPNWLINIYTEHDKRIPCFTRPVNWIRVDVDIRFYNVYNEELNARLFTLINYPLFLPQIRLQPFCAQQQPQQQPATTAPHQIPTTMQSCNLPPSRLILPPILTTNLQGQLPLCFRFPGLLMRPIIRVHTPPTKIKMAELVPTKERYRRVWADMPDIYTIRSSQFSSEHFTLVLYALPDPAIASMRQDPESDMPPPLKGWRMVVMVIPPSKLGVQNVCHHEYFVPVPSAHRPTKRSHDEYLLSESHDDKTFPFHVLWEIKNRKKHYVSWSAVIEFSQNREEMQHDLSGNFTARLLVSSVPFHFGGAANGSGPRHLIGNAFLPKPGLCDRSDFQAKPRFTHLHSISLPRPAAYASRFQLPVTVHAFCLPELTPEKERIINMTPYDDYCKQMVSYVRSLNTKRIQQPFIDAPRPTTRPSWVVPQPILGQTIHGELTSIPPSLPMNIGWGNQPWFRMCSVATRFGLIPHWPSQYPQPPSGLSRIQEDAANLNEFVSGPTPAVMATLR